MHEEEAKRESAACLFRQERLTLAQASRFAGITQLEFQHLLASRRIPVHYGAEDLDEDIQTLKKLRRL